MCGIVAGISDEPIAPVLLDGLKRVEYRGYDSAGVATLSRGRIAVRKDVGRISELEAKQHVSEMEGAVGIAHTRWATHGGVSSRNAHPLVSCRGAVAIVHNGVIGNYLELKSRLVAGGHTFRSETDSEVIAHVIEEEYEREQDPVRSTLLASKRLRGQYAFVAVFRDRPGLLTGARNDAPLVAGLADRKKFLTSDVLAFIPHTDRAVFIDNTEVVELTSEGLRAFNSRGREVKTTPTQLAWELASVSKRNYAHYTMKEIHEQPATVVSALSQEPARLEEFTRILRESGSVVLTASGSSFHAALMLKSRLNREARMRCDAVLSGELSAEAHFVDGDTAVVAISQSGETADVLQAVKVARGSGAKVLSIINAAGSALARESDAALLLNCGPEVGVAATKSFTAQLMVGNLVVDTLTGRDTLGRPEEVAEKVERALQSDGMMKRIASAYKERPDFYFIARGHHYPIAQEGALKLKELSYVHAEGMPASELKHGTLALIEEGTPVVVIAPGGPEYGDTVSSALELEARGAEIIGISDRDHPVFKHKVRVPRANDSVSPVLEAVPLQLLAYWMATERKKNPDYPRNLAKSVTVR